MSTPKESEMVERELKPCPFCGGPAALTIHKIDPNVVCPKCNYVVPQRADISAIDAWNLRAPALVLSEGDREALERIAIYCNNSHAGDCARRCNCGSWGHDHDKCDCDCEAHAATLRALASRGKL